MSFTLTTLKQSIQDWTQNSESTFVGELDFIIKNAEERIFKVVDLDYFRKNVTGSMSSSNQFLQKPSDYLASFSLSYVNASSENVFLLQKDVNFIQEYNPNPATTGSPKYYASYDVDNFIVGPTPDSNYTVELHYFYRPASITTDDSGTTWLSENAELALLYGSLIEAYIYMKGAQDIMSMYNQRFQEAIIGVKMLGEAKETTDEYRTGKVIRSKE